MTTELPAGDENETSAEAGGVARRTVLRVGAVGGVGVGLAAAQGLVVPALQQQGLWSADGVFTASATTIGDLLLYTEAFPTSPLILEPFKDELVVPQALAPEQGYEDWDLPPGPGLGQQNALGNEQHQMWRPPGLPGYPDPIVYKIDVRVSTHDFTSSPVLPITKGGKPTVSFDADGKTYARGVRRTLPPSTIYGFNGTFPGPMINAEYGKPALVRFSNHLDENPDNLDRQDFGSPPAELSFLTHLHNGHTAPESDGNPHYSMRQDPRTRATGRGCGSTTCT